MTKLTHAFFIVSICASGCLVLLALPACMTKKVTAIASDPTTGVFSTNTVTEVDTNNLALDVSVLQGATATAVSILVQKDPAALPALEDAKLAMEGILFGNDTNTTARVLQLTGQTTDPNVQAEIGNLLQLVSGVEQAALQKYGATVGGQISVAVTRAVYAGFLTALPR